MAPYIPIYIARSDGKLETISPKTRKKEPNSPTEAQQDDRPDSKGIINYYKELDIGDAKEVEWRRKLGGMLMRESGEKEHQGKSYILAALPENYRLFEHVKYTASENGEPVKSAGNQADDPNHRQDSYLYGHPQGPTKRFRSPADFFPHLLWLATDEDGDPDNCSCKICAPEDIQVFDKPTAKAIIDTPRKEEFPPVQKEIVQRANAEPLVVLPKRPLVQESSMEPVNSDKYTFP